MMKAAIVGCGGIAQVHGEALNTIPGIEVVGCVDVKPERADAMAEKVHGRAYYSYEEMLRNEKPDVVHLCTPNYLHTPMAVEAAKRGIAVLTEKPPVIHRAQWEELKEARKLVPIGVCLQNRYNPNMEAAMALVNSGEYGEVLGARAFMTWRRDENYYADDWHGKRALEGGGTLATQAIHTLDLMLQFLGKPDVVRASTQNHHLEGVIEVEDTVEIFLKSGEKRGILYGSNCYTRDALPFVEVHLEKAVLSLTDGKLTIETPKETIERTFAAGRNPGKMYWGAGHLSCIEDFYRCVEHHLPYRNDLYNCEASVEVLLQTYGE